VFEADRSALEAVPFRVTNPRRISSRRYYDEEFFKLECERLWPHVWQMACRLEEIPDIGDWVEYKILDKSVIVVRTKEGIKAFHNACRHRGVRFANGHGNCAAQGFVCPFHGWRWNMDGENIFVFGRAKFNEEDLDRADIALVPCRVESWGGCAFINFDDNAPRLLECLGPAAERMDARNVGQLKVEWWRSAVLPVNWKLAAEAFMEGYHVMTTHPQLYAVTIPEHKMFGAESPLHPPPPRSSHSARDYVDVTLVHLAKLSEGMAGMVHAREVAIAESLRDMELPEDVGAGATAFYTRLRDEITAQGRIQGMPVPDLNKAAADHPFKAVEFFFPHYFLLPMFSAMSSYRVRPLGPETCLFEIWSLAFFPEDEKRDPPVAPEPSTHDDPSFPEIPQQDYSNLPIQQLGLHAKGFEFMRLSPEVEGMISNYQRLIDGYIAGLEPERLARAAGLACGGLDSPIVDIGF
jgi:nitrite reductase/ring-hydroxylating ferredoxin subunit